MDTKTVLELLSGISVGTIVAWVGAICVIIAAICTGTIKLYKLFTKYKMMKDKDIKQEQSIAQHEKTLKEIGETLQAIQSSINEQKGVSIDQLRYTIVEICDAALAAGEITASKLRSLEELYRDYNGLYKENGYAQTLVMRARELPIAGQQDD